MREALITTQMTRRRKEDTWHHTKLILKKLHNGMHPIT